MIHDTTWYYVSFSALIALMILFRIIARYRRNQYMARMARMQQNQVAQPAAIVQGYNPPPTRGWPMNNVGANPYVYQNIQVMKSFSTDII